MRHLGDHEAEFVFFTISSSLIGCDVHAGYRFCDQQLEGTILDATVWTYKQGIAISDAPPTLPPRSCDDVVGGAITQQAYAAGVAIAALVPQSRMDIV
jgi:hypothetical protein